MHEKWVSMEKPGHSCNSSIWEGWKSSFLKLESDRYLLEYGITPGWLFQGRRGEDLQFAPWITSNLLRMSWEAPSGSTPQQQGVDQPLSGDIPSDLEPLQC